MQIKHLVAAGCMSLVSCAPALCGSLGFSQIYSFGDSLSDNGNAAAALGGFQSQNYAPNELTDGPTTNPSTTSPQGVWVEQLASKLGLPNVQPGFVVPGGTNFAVAYADTGVNSSFPSSSTAAPGVDQQVGYYLSGAHNTASATGLYTLWAGANDIADFKDAGTAADNLEKNILSLHTAGAKTFLWANLPPLGSTPKVSTLGTLAVAYANSQSSEFNSEWQADISTLQADGIDVIGLDVSALYGKILADNASHCTPGAADPYCFANVKDSAQGVSGINPNTYLFWDAEHPTTAADALIADAAYADLSAGASTATPEPAVLGLAGLGLAAIGFARLRNRRSR